jgi:DNA modification methylase
MLPINQIIEGNSLDILPTFPAASVDVIFADPPYFMQLRGDLWRPNQTQVDAVDDEWDKFADFPAYDLFTEAWLNAVRRVMKPHSSLWISGTYHNIHRVGRIMQDMGFWLLNTVTWHRVNATPNFNGTRLKNDVEFIIWAKKDERSRYTFNYRLLKHMNGDTQMGSFWQIPQCSGSERLRLPDGTKLHSTQKPEALLRRILLGSARPGDVVLDPFSGTGTTAAVAKQLHLNWIGIETDPTYAHHARERLAKVKPMSPDDNLLIAFQASKPEPIPFVALLDAGYLRAGQPLYLDGTAHVAEIMTNGKLRLNGSVGSIHGLGKQLKNTHSCNGWKVWRYDDDSTGERPLIDALRETYRRRQNTP